MNSLIFFHFLPMKLHMLIYSLKGRYINTEDYNSASFNKIHRFKIQILKFSSKKIIATLHLHDDSTRKNKISAEHFLLLSIKTNYIETKSASYIGAVWNKFCETVWENL